MAVTLLHMTLQRRLSQRRSVAGCVTTQSVGTIKIPFKPLFLAHSHPNASPIKLDFIKISKKPIKQIVLSDFTIFKDSFILLTEFKGKTSKTCFCLRPSALTPSLSAYFLLNSLAKTPFATVYFFQEP